MSIAVGAPPTTIEHALGIAAELHAVAPADEARRPGAVRDMAGALLDGRAGADEWRPTLRLSPKFWELGFRE